MTADIQPGDDTPHLGSLRFGPALAGALYLLLVGSAALALAARRFPEALPTGLSMAAPWVFLAFLICFSAYRLVLVRAGKYRAGKAFFQVGAAALFFMLLLPWKEVRPPPASDPLGVLLSDARPEVRALAAEAVRGRPEAIRYAPRLAEALSDPDAAVRREAHRSLVQLSGTDLGGPEDPLAKKAWKEKYP